MTDNLTLEEYTDAVAEVSRPVLDVLRGADIGFTMDVIGTLLLTVAYSTKDPEGFIRETCERAVEGLNGQTEVVRKPWKSSVVQ